MAAEIDFIDTRKDEVIDTVKVSIAPDGIAFKDPERCLAWKHRGISAAPPQ